MTAAAIPARRWRTRAHRWWRAMRDGLDDCEARATVVALGFVLAVVITWRAFGMAFYVTAVGFAVAALLWDRGNLRERIDTAADDADLARQQANEARADAAAAVAEVRVVRDHLEGREPEQTGRHARRAA